VRILHVDKFLRRQGGAASYMLDVGAAQRRTGHDVEFFSMRHPDNVNSRFASLFPPEVDFASETGNRVSRSVRVASTMVFNRDAAAGMAAVVREFRPDVVHLHNIYHQLSPSILRPLRSARIPAVMTVHDYKLVCPSYRLLANGEPCLRCVEGSVFNAVSQRCMDDSRAASALVAIESGLHRTFGMYGAVRRFIAPSSFLENLLRRGGVAADRVVHVPHFSEVDPGGVPTAAERNGSVLFAGRLSGEKGVATLIRAFASTSLPSLIIAGEGPEREALEDLARASAPERVTFLGAVGKERVTELQRSCSLGVLPAEWFENQPMSILEAFGHGLPMIGTGLGGISELIEHERTGLIVAPKTPSQLADALQRLADPNTADSLAAAARQRAIDVHNLDAHLARLTTIYHEVSSCSA
jgi:glycosyltransferase involved in cell wall biosynthesis